MFLYGELYHITIEIEVDYFKLSMKIVLNISGLAEPLVAFIPLEKSP